ncbi:kynureninase [Undibacterium sp. RTI2.1]|uniref:kynureninase n=1 Tax=unclassified Undibacterium TaxID=2630295 RepID=UPI002AB4D285|nr:MULTISPECIES: kynureninase [unclassified Undibacterium]MDY7540637.1 kynureninase [Undibacterium sp. 5I1]MEB0029701.1 kynureninase [Undibacterium sp. RTI2.1]MEB0117507.1 kynureninase [Undibacterium sp. RTI2.2]MEB0230813.1 kynureninase [Undibacterium sp. 10I3]MEB0256602.1 kynureninase [Undibacterium sp. 5I1]
MTTLHRQHCLDLDVQDPLATLREEFDLPKDVIYLDGNSLGAMPKASLTRAQEVIRQEWGNDLIKSWNKAGWFDLPSRLGDMLAPLIGAAPDEVVVTDSTSINLFKALAAALHLQASNPVTADRKVIVTERSNFPTDIYMAEGITRWLDRGYQIKLVDTPDQLAAAIDQTTAVVMLTHANYRSGYLHDMVAVTAHAHAQGALMLWDLAHSAGAVQVELNQAQADFAVGCTYKYLNGGPGAPAFIWVAARHQAAFSHPLSGWWGHTTPFEMAPSFVGTPGIRRALCGTQPIVSLAMVESGLAVFSKTSMAAIRAKSLALTELFIQLVESRCANQSLELVTPRDQARRGSHVSFTHPHGYAVMQALIARGIIGDYREPAIMRFGFTPLYTSFVDVWDAVEGLRDILESQAYELNAERHAVT